MKTLVSEQHNEGEPLIPTPVNNPKNDSGVEPPEHVETGENKFLDTDKDNVPKEATPTAKAGALAERGSKKHRRRRRSSMQMLVAETEQDTSASQLAQAVTKSKGKRVGRSGRNSPKTIDSGVVLAAGRTKSRTSRGAQDLPDGRKPNVDKHVIKSEDEPGETRRRPPMASTDEPGTIVDMTMIPDSQEEEGEDVTGDDTVEIMLSAPETKIVPDSQEDEGDEVMGTDQMEEVARWEEDPNSQLVFD